MYVMVDVEADGPCPGEYSMIAIGAIVVESSLNRTFLGYLAPIAANWQEAALHVAGFSRDKTLSFRDAAYTMRDFRDWLLQIKLEGESGGGPSAKRLIFVADNNGFDWQFVNYYLWHFTGGNPFGFSSMNLGSLYKGLKGDMFASFKHLRKTHHDHNPLNDAKGNAEAMLAILKGER